MPKNTLYVTGFSRESKAADLAPDFEKFGQLVRLDIPPPRTDDGEKYAFVEYKEFESCEKALELNGQTLPYTIKDGLVVQIARSDPYSTRRGGFRGGRGSYGYGGAPRGGYGYPAPRGGRGGYGYGSGSYGYASRGGYPPRGGYGGYGSRGGYEGGRGEYGRGYDDYERERGYEGGRGGYARGGYARGGYSRGGYEDSRGYPEEYSERDYRGPEARDYPEGDYRDDREPAYDPRADSYREEPREARRGSREPREPREAREPREDREGARESREPREAGEGRDYGRGKYSRSPSRSPHRARDRSRSPERYPAE